VLLIAATRLLHLNLADIGFKWKLLPRGILTGIAIGGSAFIAAYAIEIIIAASLGKAPSLRFYATSYNIIGNTALNGGLLFIVISIVGNIINVTMENSVFSGLMITAGERRHSFFFSNGFYSSFLFGLWHGVMPLRNYVDGVSSLGGTIAAMLMLFSTSFIFSIQLGMQFKQASSSLWDGMTVHFINNASVNLFHVIYSNGEESQPVLRLTIAGTIMFIVVTVRWFIWKRKNAENIATENMVAI
jgi:membrane protease YdiL (CAAX protease family)